jgi:molybdenum cofactor sulfurtransferase
VTSEDRRQARPEAGLGAYAPDDLGDALTDFVRRYPQYEETAAIDELRATEYARLGRAGHTYLDYTGGGQYAQSQLERHHALLRERVLGNPHSHNPSSAASTRLMEEARAAVRDFFGAAAAEYEVIFTANASGALKLVGEAYPFRPGSVCLLSYDNHNSVNGIREFAHAKGAAISYIPVRRPELRLDARALRRALRAVVPGADHLFAYPAQSNFSGVQHPMEWVAEAHELGWDVIVDCAAFAPTNRLDLSVFKPDFVPISFYKLFGYPTGVGALIARREALAKLRRPWFAGGTITVASVQDEGWYRLAPPPAGFEDGTVDYLGLPAVVIGLEHLRSIGIETIHTRVMALAGWLLEELAQLRHSGGAPMVRIFGPQTTARRGATLALYLLDPDGHPYDVYGVEAAAGRELISIRTGCFCNPGDGEVAHNITHEDMERCFNEPRAVVSLMECQQVIEDATGKVPNTVRVSLGVASDFADAYRFMTFVAGYRDRGVRTAPERRLTS